MIQLGYDFIKSRLLQTAFELDIFTRIGNESKTPMTLTRELGANPNSLELFLNALVSLGLLSHDGRSFSNTKYGLELFVRDKPLFIGDLVMLQQRSCWDWLKLKDCVLTGVSLDQPDFFKTNNEERTAGFARAMHNTAMGHAEYLAKKVSLKKHKRLLDVGGGPGTFSVQFLKANPDLKATIFDLPTTLKTTRKYIKEAGLESRVSYQEGDFNQDDIRGTFDACFMSHIIHGQDAEKNQLLFKKIFGALEPGGVFIVQDFYLNPDRVSPQFSVLFALQMLIHTESGRTYTFEEVEAWMTSAGFKSTRRSAFKLPRSIALIFGEKA
jgi:ubiquinone/menaquinone biosynthesis C-methylase UbiE